MVQPQRSRQLVEHRLRLLQIGGVEPFGEPAVNGAEEVAGLGGLVLGVPEAGEGGRGAEFSELGGLGAGDVNGPVQRGLRLLLVANRSDNQRLAHCPAQFRGNGC